MKKTLLILTFVVCAMLARAQSMVMEIQWSDGILNYSGLVVMYPNNSGCCKVKYYLPYEGWVWCYQDARLSTSTDIYGNVTSYINCFNPRCSEPYAADSFVIYPNGQMYTRDAAGSWSTRIVAVVIQPLYWAAKKAEYGL